MFIDGEHLYYPDEEEYAISNPILTEILSCASEFEFELPKSNLKYHAIKNRQSMIQITKDRKEIFYGEVREAYETLEQVKEVYCVGELAFLFDSIQPQRRFQNMPPEQFLIVLINEHNSQVEEKKRFQVGIVTVKDSNDSIYRYTNYEDTLTAIRKKLCEPLGGYLRIRKVDGVRYLDLVTLDEYGVTAKQPIQFGRNLLDYVKGTSGTGIATAVVPLGAKLEEQEVEGLDAYVTIESVNDGKNYICSDEAYGEYGMVKKVVQFQDVTVPSNLKRKGEEWLSSNQYEDVTLDLTAVDLSNFNVNIDSYNVGDKVRAIAEPFGMNTVFPLQKKVTHLQSQSSSNVILSNSMKKSYTEQTKDSVREVSTSIPQESEILNRAKQNASQLIQTATNGNIYLVTDEDGRPKEMLVMDTADINTAQKVWRWNINGLGYSSTGYNGEYALAMTMDGQFVADFITAGTMSANRVYGGTLSGVHIDLSSTKEELADIEINSAGNMLCLKMNAYFVESKDNSTGQGFSMSNSNIYGTNKYGNKTMVLGNHQGGFINLFSLNGENSTIDMYIGYDGMTTTGSVYCKNLSVSGTKSRVAETKDYSDRLMYCYETPSPLFGDVGEGTIDDTGKCMVFLDDVFSETIDIDCQYQVFLQTYGAGECYVTERNPMYFMVEGTKGLSFGWEIKATQKGFDTLRLAEYEKDAQEEDTTLSSTYSYLQTLLYNAESEVI